MPFKKGQSGNPKGKPKGALSHQNREASRIAAELGIDPFIILLHFAANNWEVLGYKSEYGVKYSVSGDPYDVPTIEPELRVSAAKEACKYIIPQLKSVEHSASDGIQLLAPLIIRPPVSQSESETG